MHPLRLWYLPTLQMELPLLFPPIIFRSMFSCCYCWSASPPAGAKTPDYISLFSLLNFVFKHKVENVGLAPMLWFLNFEPIAELQWTFLVRWDHTFEVTTEGCEGLSPSASFNRVSKSISRFCVLLSATSEHIHNKEDLETQHFFASLSWHKVFSCPGSIFQEN